jgi:arylsulfatase A-like enzyme
MDNERFFMRKKGVAFSVLNTLTALSVCVIFAGVQLASANASAPDIVIVVVDDLGFSDFGCYGSEIQTPNIDRLADHGIRFSQFLSENKCNPSRTSLMTGQYYIRGYNGGTTLTIPEGLKAAGYQTYVCGKWDVVADTPGGPLKRGFDHFYGNIRGCGSQFAPLGLQRDGTDAEHEWRDNKDFYYTHAITENAARYIEQTPDEIPLFLLVTYTAPHWPMHALPEDIDKYKGKYAEGWDVLRAQRLERMKAMGLVPQNTPLPPRDGTGTAWVDAPNKEWQQRRMEVYAAMIDAVDQGVGQLVQQLKQAGRFENTLFVVLSDNGASAEDYGPNKTGRFLNSQTRDGGAMRIGSLPSIMPGPEDTWQSVGANWAFLSSTPFRMYKGFEHQGGHAVPLIMHWPQVIQDGGQISDELCHVIDLLPTALDAAGVSYPETFDARRIDPVDGKSLLPLLKGEARDGHDTLYWGAINGKAIRQGPWKLVRARQNPWELYDMTADRTELNDLAAQHPEKVQQLEQQWEAWRDSVSLPQAWRDPAIFSNQ